MAYVPAIFDTQVAREFVDRLYRYYVTHIPAVITNYYNLDNINTQVSADNQQLTDINLPFHLLKFNLFYHQPIFLSDTTPTRTSSEGTIESLSNDPIQVTTFIFCETLFKPTVGDKIAIDVNVDNLLLRRARNIFTVEQVEYPTQTRDPLTIARLTIRRDLDISYEGVINRSIISNEYIVAPPYNQYMLFSNYADYLRLLALIELIKEELRARYTGKTLSNSRTSKDYIHELDEILSSILNIITDSTYQSVLRIVLIPELHENPTVVFDFPNIYLRAMTDEEVLRARRYRPELYQFDNFYTVDNDNGTIAVPVLPELDDYLNNNTPPTANDILAYQSNLQSLTTIELAQLVVLVEIVIRNMLLCPETEL